MHRILRRRLAATRLQPLTAGRPIVCQEKDRDRFGASSPSAERQVRILAPSWSARGVAWAFTRYSVDYLDQQEEACTANRGEHAHDCVPAWEWQPQKNEQ
jgi:hypothetical protein